MQFFFALFYNVTSFSFYPPFVFVHIIFFSRPKEMIYLTIFFFFKNFGVSYSAWSIFEDSYVLQLFFGWIQFSTS